MRMTDRVSLRCLPQQAFRGLVDLERSPEWALSSGVIERRKVTEGPHGVGTEFAALDKLLGRETEFVVRFTEFEPGQRVAASWSDPIRGGWSASFTGTNGSTELEFTAEMYPTGPLRLLAPVLGAVMKRAMRKDLARFKTWVEQQPSHHTDP